ncbi:MAG TPA: hypothetical protein VFV42_08750, partial [Acidimicrobiales bacterium]|nr:hypothetical protein [Acidimicrobiales bacterium]
VDVWAYLARPCTDRWGQTFLEQGAMEVRLLRPVYDGERVVARLDDDGSLTCTGSNGEVRAAGRASVDDDLPPVRSLPTADRPDEVPPAAPELLAPGTVLGTLRYRHRADPAYLADVRDDSPLYEGGAVVHPGQLARQANYVLSSSVRLGPWIHVSTRAWHRGLVRDGDDIEVRGVVTDEREHKGHRFVDLDVEISANGRSVWSAAHTAIWQPRQERA